MLKKGSLRQRWTENVDCEVCKGNNGRFCFLSDMCILNRVVSARNMSNHDVTLLNYVLYSPFAF